MKKIVSVMIVIAVVFQAYIGFLLESNREMETIQTNVQKFRYRMMPRFQTRMNCFLYY